MILTIKLPEGANAEAAREGAERRRLGDVAKGARRPAEEHTPARGPPARADRRGGPETP